MSVCIVFACVYTCIYKCTHLHVCIWQLDITLSCLPWLISIIYSFLETKVEHEPLRSAILAVQQWGIHIEIYDFHGLQNNSLCFYCFVAGKTNESDSPPSFEKRLFPGGHLNYLSVCFSMLTWAFYFHFFFRGPCSEPLGISVTLRGTAMLIRQTFIAVDVQW